MDPHKSNYQLGPTSPLFQSEIAFRRGNNKRVHIDKACYLPLSNTECHHFWEHLGLRKDTFDAGCLLCLGVLVRLASAAVNYVSRQQLSTSVAAQPVDQRILARLNAKEIYCMLDGILTEFW